MALSTAAAKKVLANIETSYANARNLIRREIIEPETAGKDVDISSALERSTMLLGEYATVDWQHRNDIQNLISRIKSYAQDPSRTRPLNIIMQARPGSGKSHFINCIAKS